MPLCSACLMATSITLSMSMSLSASSCRKIFRACATVTFLFFFFFGTSLPSISCRSSPMPSRFGPANIPIIWGISCFSSFTSISSSSSSPFSSRFFTKARPALSFRSGSCFGSSSLSTPPAKASIIFAKGLAAVSSAFDSGTRASIIRSSASSLAFSSTSSRRRLRTLRTASWARSRTMLSTSRPT